jgi:hypothetical protein
VPQVASDAKTYAVNYQPAYSAWPPQTNDQAPATPFESLLDDSAQGAPDRPSPPASNDRAARADRPDRPDRPPQAAKTNDNAKSSNPISSDAKSSEVKFSAAKFGHAKSSDANSTDAISADDTSVAVGNGGKTGTTR